MHRKACHEIRWPRGDTFRGGRVPRKISLQDLKNKSIEQKRSRAMSCSKCGAESTADGSALHTCNGCQTKYCSKECQRSDWKSHKQICARYQAHACWICKETSKEGEPVYRACACRGDKGFGHLECFVDYAKRHRKERAFALCPLCRQYFRNEIQQTLARAKVAEALSSGDTLQHLEAHHNMGHAYLNQGKNQAAYDSFTKVIDFFMVHCGECDMLLPELSASAALCMAKALAQMGKIEEALKWLLLVAHNMEREGVSWKDSLEYCVIANLAGVYTQLGRTNEALPYAERSLELARCKTSVPEHKESELMTMQTLANIYSELGQHDKAVPLAREAHKKTKEAYGSSHPLTKFTKQSMVNLEGWAQNPELSKKNSEAEARKKAVAVLAGLVNRTELNGALVEVCMYYHDKKRYVVEIRGVKNENPGMQKKDIFVKPANLIFQPGTVVFIHSLDRAKEYNFKEAIVKSFSRKKQKFEIEVGSQVMTIMPGNLLPKYQADMTPEKVYVHAHLLTDIHNGTWVPPSSKR